MKIILPTVEQLQPLYDEAVEGQTEEQWLDNFLNSVVTLLKKDPLWYRAYGIYWWPLKQLLINRDLVPYDHVDAEWVERVNYDNKAYLVLAAFAYHDDRQNIGAQLDEVHVLEYDDGTIDSYTMVDEELELQVYQ